VLVHERRPEGARTHRPAHRFDVISQKLTSSSRQRLADPETVQPPRREVVEARDRFAPALADLGLRT
jgi:DNA-binding TFAR19-related protein (PDSD5 family)